jgi:transcriptional regulator with XRE-family HTH domain
VGVEAILMNPQFQCSPAGDCFPVTEVIVGFGARVRAKRVSEGISLKDFAERINLSVGYWSRIERELENPPRDQYIERTAAVLGFRSDDLFVEARRLPPDMREDLSEVVRIYRAKRQEWVMRLNAAKLLREKHAQQVWPFAATTPEQQV